jgi:hypothetical protein
MVRADPEVESDTNSSDSIVEGGSVAVHRFDEPAFAMKAEIAEVLEDLNWRFVSLINDANPLSSQLL